MKLKYFPLAISFLFLAATLTACGDGKKDDNKEETAAEKEMSQKWPRSCEEPFTARDTIQLNQSTFVITTQRQPDETLPTVKDNLDHEFYDNRVTITITRDGSEFFNHSFTKEAFADYLNESQRNGVVLCGMAYDDTKTGGSHLCIAAQLGAPGEPEYAFTIDIPTSGGAFSILRDNSGDHNGEPAEESTE